MIARTSDRLFKKRLHLGLRSPPQALTIKPRILEGTNVPRPRYVSLATSGEMSRHRELCSTCIATTLDCQNVEMSPPDMSGEVSRNRSTTLVMSLIRVGYLSRVCIRSLYVHFTHLHVLPLVGDDVLAGRALGPHDGRVPLLLVAVLGVDTRFVRGRAFDFSRYLFRFRFRVSGKTLQK